MVISLSKSVQNLLSLSYIIMKIKKEIDFVQQNTTVLHVKNALSNPFHSGTKD